MNVIKWSLKSLWPYLTALLLNLGILEERKYLTVSTDFEEDVASIASIETNIWM